MGIDEQIRRLERAARDNDADAVRALASARSQIEDSADLLELLALEGLARAPASIHAVGARAILPLVAAGVLECGQRFLVSVTCPSRRCCEFVIVEARHQVGDTGIDRIALGHGMRVVTGLLKLLGPGAHTYGWSGLRYYVCGCKRHGRPILPLRLQGPYVNALKRAWTTRPLR